jgi:hypothetical protein
MENFIITSRLVSLQFGFITKSLGYSDDGKIRMMDLPSLLVLKLLKYNSLKAEDCWKVSGVLRFITAARAACRESTPYPEPLAAYLLPIVIRSILDGILDEMPTTMDGMNKWCKLGIPLPDVIQNLANYRTVGNADGHNRCPISLNNKRLPNLLPIPYCQLASTNNS